MPSTLSIADFCQFAAALLPRVCEMRMVKNAADASSTDASTYSVILRFEDQDGADAFAKNYHNRRFNSLVEGTCQCLFLQRIELVRYGSATPAL